MDGGVMSMHCGAIRHTCVAEPRCNALLDDFLRFVYNGSSKLWFRAMESRQRALFVAGFPV